MGKAARVTCITIPWVLTLASFLCLLLIELSGYKPNNTASQFYFFQANFTGLSTASASTLANTTDLTLALESAQQTGQLAKLYQVHLWNYCQSDTDTGNTTKMQKCSKRESRFVFDPVEVWGLNATGTSAAAAASATATSGNVVSSAVASAEAHLKNSTEALEDKLLGKTGREAMDAYRKVATWMFLAYEISFWTTLATIVCGILAIFSRWGSFLTWLFSVVSTFFTVAAVLTSTILFGTVVGAFKTLLHPYHVQLSLGTHSLILNWLAVAFSVGATLFWLLSVCCCSGRSNPHHRSNKGGLWQAEPKGQGYGDFRGRGGVRVEKTGGGYERVGSPVWGQGSHGGQEVPLQSYPQQGYAQQTPQHGHQQGGAFEPFRHG